MNDRSELPYLLAFSAGVTLTAKDSESVLQWGHRTLSLGAASREVVGALKALSSGGVSEQELVDRAADGGVTAQATILYTLAYFKQLGILTYTVSVEGLLLANLTPTSPAHPAMPGAVAFDVRYALSRFACLRREEKHFVLESPLGHAKLRMFDARVAALFHLLAEPRKIDDLCEESPNLPKVVTAMLLGLLLGSGAIAAEGSLDDARERSLETWSFHDLLFHTRSRSGRHAEPSGATYPFKDSLPPLPAVKPRAAGPFIPLHRPDIAALREQDLPFTRVLEDRRSVRVHGEKRIHVDRIGELLYRSARVRALHDRGEGLPYALTSRPYPGGGACYELEVYLVVQACDGLEPGLYHYDPQGHALSMIAGMSPAVATLLDDARVTGGISDGVVHTLVVLAARFQRLSWKYESIAYALLLKDVGVLYQTMYLVATAMGLAPCALGGGDSDLFAEAAGLDYYAETSVGEFLLGSRAED